MLEPADVLLLDEPTNDLDIPTLEVLEESLLEFPGALVLVTHDRYLLDRVSTRLLALDGRGGVVPYADYAQWESGAGGGREAAPSAARPRAAASGGRRQATAAPRSRRGSATASSASGSRWRRASSRPSSASRRASRPPPIPRWPRTTRRCTSASPRWPPRRPRWTQLYARWAELEAKTRV